MPAVTEPDDVGHDTTDASVDARHGLVVTTHHLASKAGAGVLAAGGNAVDAAVAANAVVGVVLPDTCGPGGDLFALVHRPGDPVPAALNASGRAGSGADAQRLRREGHAAVPSRGPEGITVPGCVDGWEALLARFGTWSLGDVLAPAIAVAADGFEASPELAASLGATTELLSGQPSAGALYPGGQAPAPGTTLRRRRLAETLRTLAEQGRAGFYGGAVGAEITEATGGLVTADDLATVQADWVDPVGATVHGWDGWTVPPNSRGYVTLAGGWVAERLGSAPGSALHTHHLIEAYRAVAADSIDLVADPARIPLSASDLVSARRLGPLLDAIDADSAGVWGRPAAAAGGTTYLCCRDGAGMGVSLIQSNFHGIGSGLSAGDTGVFLHDRGAGFCLVPGHANELAPGNRPAHTLSPTLWTVGGGLRMLLGTRGGSFQPQILLQLIDHILGRGLDPAEAMRRPRWVVDDEEAERSVVHVESRMDPEVVAGLETRGHLVRTAGPWEVGWGPVAVISVDAGKVTGAADPRVSTAAVAMG
ncbi:MAG: gamma-glutamyltransferase [Acidimicrobiia bacterium]